MTDLMDSAFLPEQTTAAGKVLHDAVFDFTGRVDFISVVDRLFREEMAYGKVDDPKIWFKNLAKMVEENQFLTETAKKLQSVPGNEQLSALEAFATEKLNNL
jgi:hypothetical protein